MHRVRLYSPRLGRPNAFSEASELWKPKRWLAERRREVDPPFDLRYSVLPVVYAWDRECEG